MHAYMHDVYMYDVCNACKNVYVCQNQISIHTCMNVLLVGYM